DLRAVEGDANDPGVAHRLTGAVIRDVGELEPGNGLPELRIEDLRDVSGGDAIGGGLTWLFRLRILRHGPLVYSPASAGRKHDQGPVRGRRAGTVRHRASSNGRIASVSGRPLGLRRRRAR